MSLPPAADPIAPTVAELGRAWGYETVAGVPPEFARRLYHWCEMCGAAEQPLLETFRALPDDVAPLGDGWVDHFAARGDQAWAGGRVLDALLLYEIAMFTPPFLPMAAAQAAAYRRHADAYLEAGASFDPPLQRVEIPVGDRVVVGYHRVPDVPGTPPAVLITGGADGWKGHRSLHATQEAFLAAGWRTLTVDLPGTGESPFALEPGCHRTLIPILRWLADRDDVDAKRVGAHMRSFGGYHAAALTAELSREQLPAIVAVSPPIHHAFHRPPPFLPEDRRAWFASLSLDDQGILGPNRSQPELLVVHALPDPLCPIEDTHLLAERGMLADTLIYAQDFHTAMLNGSDHLDLSIRWLRKRVEGRPLP